jgi:hypothetical protein
VSATTTVTPRKCAFVIFMVSATFFIEFPAFYPFSVALDKRNFEILRNMSESKM